MLVHVVVDYASAMLACLSACLLEVPMFLQQPRVCIQARYSPIIGDMLGHPSAVVGPAQMH